MAKRMSNKARIQQKAEEAKAAKAEKTAKKTAKKKTAKKKTAKKKVSKKSAAPPQRLKVVWKVYDSGYKEVACFPYPEKKKAEKMAADLEKKGKGTHFVNADKV